jgi:hypothetical protein
MIALPKVFYFKSSHSAARFFGGVYVVAGVQQNVTLYFRYLHTIKAEILQ